MKDIAIRTSQPISVQVLANVLQALADLHRQLPISQFKYEALQGSQTMFVYKIDLADGRSLSSEVDTAMPEPGAKPTSTDKWKTDELPKTFMVQQAVVELIKASAVLKILVKW